MTFHVEHTGTTVANLDHFVTIVYDPPKDGYGGSILLEDFSPGLVDLKVFPQLADHIDGSACSERCRQGQPR